MNRRILGRVTLALSTLSLALATVPFVGSLGPNVRADASLPRMDVSSLKAGQPELRDHPLYGDLYGGFSWSLLFLRHSDGKLSAWEVPTRDGKVAMPDIHWWRPFYTCERFDLIAATSNGNAYFKCNDSQVPSDYWEAEWQWSESGRALGQSVDDMQAAIGVFEGSDFVVGRRR